MGGCGCTGICGTDTGGGIGGALGSGTGATGTGAGVAPGAAGAEVAKWEEDAGPGSECLRFFGFKVALLMGVFVVLVAVATLAKAGAAANGCCCNGTPAPATGTEACLLAIAGAVGNGCCNGTATAAPSAAVTGAEAC